jgi:broad specificity phosphatase PhoE
MHGASTLPVPTVIYLTRHAEKTSGADPALSERGLLRARNIATMLRRAGIRHIYATPFLRAHQTAEALATRIGATVQSYDPGAQHAFARQLLALGGSALVVGHTDTIPDLIRLLGGEPGMPYLETDFDRVYQLVISADGHVTTTLLASLP